MSIALFFSSPPPHHSNPPHFPCNSNPSHPLLSNNNADTSISLFKPLFPKPHISLSKPLRAHPFKTNQNPSTKNDNHPQSLNPNSSFPSDPPSVKMPTAPWMKGPLLIPSDEVLDFSRVRKQKKHFTNEESNEDNISRNDRSLTDKIRGGRGKHAMKKILDGITKLKELSDSEKPSVKEVEVEEFEFRVPLEGVLREGESNVDVRMPWVRKEKKIVFRRMKKEIVATAAELRLPELVLKRLKSDAVKIKKWVKVKKAGVSEAVVDEIKMIWKRNELAMVKFDVPLIRNMDRAHEIVELKTGGLVVWRKKDTLVIYRGLPFESSNDFAKFLGPSSDGEPTSSKIAFSNSEDVSAENLTNRVARNEEISGNNAEQNSRLTGMEENVSLQSVHGTLYQREADRLLDGLGPRFVDWWWPKPLPVDADLLPEVVPGFTTPFRLCPPRVRSQLADEELTYLRKLARPLPTHFALGRNTKLQGLASAIIKLWEKSHIVKIAVKLGIPNTNNEQMAWELKRLTGGVLILRNKFFIIFYRGKDFIPPSVANLIVSRETELRRCQLEEESARCKAIESFHFIDETVANISTIGTFSDFRNIQTKYGLLRNGHGFVNIEIEAEKEKLEKELRKQKRKLFILKVKIERSARELAKLNSSCSPVEQAADHEMITQEERQCFRKIGLKMDSTLELGRRGIFDGVIESMHQHWKHREVVKVITMQRAFSQVIDTATWLETESGGILVAVEGLRKGHAIILYRGKNYRRPVKITSGNLLTKREALQRSLEMQRIGSLKFFAYQRQRTISNLELKLRNLQNRDENATP